MDKNSKYVWILAWYLTEFKYQFGNDSSSRILKTDYIYHKQKSNSGMPFFFFFFFFCNFNT